MVDEKKKKLKNIKNSLKQDKENYKAFKEDLKVQNEIEVFERNRTYSDPLMQIKSIAKKNWLKKARKK